MTCLKLYRNNLALVLILLSFFSVSALASEAQKGLKAYKEKNYSQCTKHLNPLAEKLPLSGILVLATCLKNEKKLKEAQNRLELIFVKNPKLKSALFLKAEILNLQKKPKKAILIYNQLIKEHPKEKKAYGLLLEILIQEKNHYETKELLLEITKIFYAKPIYIKKLCQVYIHLKLTKEALKTCQKAFTLMPKDEKANLFLAQAYFLNEKEEKAQKQYALASKKFSKSELSQRALADFYFQKKNFSIALKYYKKANKNDPLSVLSLKGIALSSFELKLYKEALEALEKACSISPIDITKEFLKLKSLIFGKNIIDWKKVYKKSFETCLTSSKK